MTTEDGSKTGALHWAWVILAVCFFNLFINYSVRLGYGVVLPEMIRSLGFGRTDAGSIYNAYLFLYIALTPLSGYLTDRLGARRVIATCSLILGVGALMMGTIHTLREACIFFAIAGLGATGMWTPVITVVQRWFSPTRRGMALGILSTGYGLGFATMGVAFPWVVSHYNWRFVWYILGLAAFLMVIINGLLLRRDPESTGKRPWGKSNEAFLNIPESNLTYATSVSLGLIFKNFRFWLIGFSYMAISYSLYGITTFLVDYARHQVGMPLDKASFLATVHGFAQIGGVLTILPLSDRLGRKRTIILSNASITACLIGILFTGKSWGLLFFFVGLLALFYGATFPIYGACAGDYFPHRVMGTVIGA